MEQLTVRTSADLVDHRRLQVDEDAARDVLAGTSLGEERVEGIITATDRLVARHLTVRLNTVLQAEELPATVANLAAGLAHVDEDRLRVSGLQLDRSICQQLGSKTCKLICSNRPALHETALRC